MRDRRWILGTNVVVLVLSLGILAAVPSHQTALANGQDKLDFAAGLEEALGHFWAIELNLDEGNAELAVVHATHPVAELYDAMKPQLQAADPAFDELFRTMLIELKDRATVDVSRAQAQEAVDDARTLVERARTLVVGDALGADPHFKLRLMKTLLETSIAEYREAVSNGIIVEVAEFQDGTAFVWRSQHIFGEVRSEISEDDAAAMGDLYTDLWIAYIGRADPAKIDELAGGIIDRINGITGDDESDLLSYVETIRELLTDAKSEYRQGNADLALSHVTKAYLDNYEFLEGPLADAGEHELMLEVEVMMREDLRSMIRNGAPVSEVDAQIDAILDRMDAVAVVVPEFGAVAVLVLSVAVAATIVLGMRTRLGLAYRT